MSVSSHSGSTVLDSASISCKVSGGGGWGGVRVGGREAVWVRWEDGVRKAGLTPGMCLRFLSSACKKHIFAVEILYFGLVYS